LHRDKKKWTCGDYHIPQRGHVFKLSAKKKKGSEAASDKKAKRNASKRRNASGQGEHRANATKQMA
jgi:hypothetical protein